METQRRRYRPRKRQATGPSRPIAGERFGDLVVIESLGVRDGRVSLEMCKRDCGNVKVLRRSNLRAGLSTNCADRERHPDPRRVEKPVRKRRKRDSLRQLTPAERLAVFERDDWTCQLCGEAIPQGLSYPHALYPSIDHRIPLALGGERAESNWQAAHFRCNSVKQHRIAA